MITEKQTKALNDIIKSSKRAVFFGGAGVSTESGIPDFRSADGIYMMNYRYPPEEILSHMFFMRKTLMDCTQKRAAKLCMSFTARRSEIIA